jgi:hypothetical protein
MVILLVLAAACNAQEADNKSEAYVSSPTAEPTAYPTADPTDRPPLCTPADMSTPMPGGDDYVAIKPWVYAELNFNPPDENGVVWVIPPSYEYDKILYWVSLYSEGGWFLGEIEYEAVKGVLRSNEVMSSWYDGKVIDFFKAGGWFMTDYYFDAENGLFIKHYYHIPGHDEKITYTPGEFMGHLLPVRLYGEEGDNFALVRDGEFVTDFIYKYDQRFTYYRESGYIPLGHEGKVGLLDADGNVAVPFIFEDIEFIDGELAFGKIDGLYGIFSVNKTVDIWR